MKQRGLFRAFTTGLTLLVGIASFGNSYESELYAQGPAAVQNSGGLTIMVIAGEDSVNIIKKKTAVKPVVEVRDRNNLPVAGASVVFLAPGSGASATFAGGARTVTVITNSAGRAAITSIQPVETGAFKIGVTASFNGQAATTSIAQTNFLTVQAAQAAGAAGAGAAGAGGGISAAAIGAIAAGVGVAAAAVVVKSKGGGSTSTRQATIGVGGVPGLSTPFNSPR